LLPDKKNFTRKTDAPKYLCLFLLVILKAGKEGRWSSSSSSFSDS